MNEKFKFYDLSDLENMMINILSEGDAVIWKYIEQEKDALKRLDQRKLFFKAIKKFKEK